MAVNEVKPPRGAHVHCDAPHPQYSEEYGQVILRTIKANLLLGLIHKSPTLTDPRKLKS